MRSLGRIVLVVGTVALSNLVQCGPGPQSPAGLLNGVIYGGIASDEAYQRVLDKLGTAQMSSVMAARITSPSDGALIPSSAPPLIAWTLTSGAIELPKFGLSEAWAHLPPVTGEVYLLLISTSASESDSDTVRVFTSKTDWQFDPVSWAKLKSKAQVTIRIYNAYLNENVVEEGPYVPPQPTRFTIGP